MGEEPLRRIEVDECSSPLFLVLLLAMIRIGSRNLKTNLKTKIEDLGEIESRGLTSQNIANAFMPRKFYPRIFEDTYARASKARGCPAKSSRILSLYISKRIWPFDRRERAACSLPYLRIGMDVSAWRYCAMRNALVIRWYDRLHKWSNERD